MRAAATCLLKLGKQTRAHFENLMAEDLLAVDLSRQNFTDCGFIEIE